MGDMPLIQALVFLGVFILLFGLIHTASQQRRQQQDLYKRLDMVRRQQHVRTSVVTLRRDTYLHSLSALERKLESLPGMERLRRLIEQSGHSRPAYQLASISTLLACAGLLIVSLVSGQWLLGLLAGFALAALPVYRLNHQRKQQLSLFDEQLPDALDSIARALKAGHPFTEAMHMISKEMGDPIGREFALTAAEINYGNDFRLALLNLLERIPSISLKAAVVSVLIQRETGGNLAETIANISGVIRSRFQLQRKVKTLSAEGRLSAWVLILLPFVLMLVIYVVSPAYLTPLFHEPLGKKLLLGSGASMLVGILWIRHIIKIDY